MHDQLWDGALKRKKKGTPGNAIITVAMPRGGDNSPGKNCAHDIRHSTQEELITAAAIVHGVE